MKRYIIGITGASGAVLAKIITGYLLELSCELHIIATETGAQVFQYETGSPIDSLCGVNPRAQVFMHDNSDMFASVASGSYDTDGMVIVPCSMSTLGKIAGGTGGGLLVRTADVCIKERRRLVVVPRETPLSTIHLRNMMTLSEAGVVIAPPVPVFYAGGDVYGNIAGRILKSMGIPNGLYKSWQGI